MKIKLSPQVNYEKIISYQFDNETIAAICGNETFSQDLSFITIENPLDRDIETGQLLNSRGELIICNFGFIPIINAYRDKAGELYVELLNFISKDAAEEEKYPDWIEI